MEKLSILAVAILILLTGCTKPNVQSIHVQVLEGDPPEPSRHGVTSHHYLLRSTKFLTQVVGKLDLATTLGLSDNQAVDELRNSIAVTRGDAPGVMVIRATGFTPKLGAKILDAIVLTVVEERLLIPSQRNSTNDLKRLTYKVLEKDQQESNN